MIKQSIRRCTLDIVGSVPWNLCKKQFHLSLILLVCSISTTSLMAQNVGVNETGAAPNTSAVLDVSSTDKGVLIPRMTSAQKNAMNPLPEAAEGLLIYQTNGFEGFYYNISTTTTPKWVRLSGNNWELDGNSGTTAGTDFIGTTDAQDVVIKTDNSEVMRITDNKKVGIRETSPTETFSLVGSFGQDATSYYNNGITQRVHRGSWVGGAGNGKTGILGTMGSHRTWHWDIVLIAHDFNTNGNRRTLHKEFITYRHYTAPPVLQDLVTHYDTQTGMNVSVTFSTNANNEIVYDIQQTNGGSTLYGYTIIARLTEVK